MSIWTHYFWCLLFKVNIMFLNVIHLRQIFSICPHILPIPGYMTTWQSNKWKLILQMSFLSCFFPSFSFSFVCCVLLNLHYFFDTGKNYTKLVWYDKIERNRWEGAKKKVFLWMGKNLWKSVFLVIRRHRKKNNC